MNTTKLAYGANEESYEAGSIYKSDSTDELYMLCEVDDQYVAVCLDDGHHWNSMCDDAAEAVEGLVFVASQATITISPK